MGTFCYTGSTRMGLIGLLITVVVMLGVGYFSFGMGPKTITITNDVPLPVVPSVATYEIMKGQATDLKDTLEGKAKATMAEGESDTVPQSSPYVSPSSPEAASSQGTGVAPEITERLMTSGFSVPAKTRTIDTIVLHSSYNPNGDAYSVSDIVKIYEGYGVSAHYLIDRSGKIYRLVEDKNIAYHAGVSKMPDGRKNVNDFSLGIEMMNKEDSEFTKAQYTAVNDLVASLKKKYSIKSVVGHSDIAPDRKTDPWNFDWKKLKN